MEVGKRWRLVRDGGWQEVEVDEVYANMLRK